MPHFCISRSVDKHLRSNGAQTLSRADDQRVHALALQVRGNKIGVIENLYALVPQVAVSSLLPDEIVVRDEHGAPKANGMSYTAQLRKAVVEFSSETEDDPLRAISAAEEPTDGAARPGDRGSTAKSIFLDEKNFEATASSPDRSCNAGGTATDHAQFRTRNHRNR